MKKITIEVFENGDKVSIITGPYRGRVGVVQSHNLKSNLVSVRVAGLTYGGEDDDWDYDGDYEGDFTLLSLDKVKSMSNAEYEKKLKQLRMIEIPGLPVGVRFLGKDLIIGDNVITKANAQMLAKFILDNGK